jgi:hypothetical protein
MRMASPATGFRVTVYPIFAFNEDTNKSLTRGPIRWYELPNHTIQHFCKVKIGA